MKDQLTDRIINEAIEHLESQTMLLNDSYDGKKGLGLFVTQDGAQWSVIVRADGLRLKMPLGSYPEMSIEEARKCFSEIDFSWLDEDARRDAALTNTEIAKYIEEQYPRDDGRVFVDRSALEKIKGTTLFYPCSGADLITPIRLFAPYVQDFWFVDRGYFRSGHQDTRHYGFDRSADRHRPVLEGDPNYRLLGVRIEGNNDLSKYHDDIDPCVRTEEYEHLPTGSMITVNKRRGYGFSAFRNVMSTIGVFFYRGDSQGEGGSGNHWLKKEHIREVLAKLSDNGLMVLDGSDGLPYRRKTFGEYSSFWRYQDDNFTSQQEIKERCKSFRDTRGNAFECVGFAGRRYGNTLVWQLQRNETLEPGNI
jgi:hypothetical protein